MLIDEPKAFRIGGGIRGPGGGNILETGCYLIGHFGYSHFLSDYERYPKLSIDPCGVCDSLEQLKAKCPELDNSERKFVVTLTKVRKGDQPSEGGWRWCKWGKYIGDHEIKYEYLADEKGIEKVFCYHIYEKIEPTESPIDSTTRLLQSSKISKFGSTVLIDCENRDDANAFFDWLNTIVSAFVDENSTRDTIKG